MRKLYLLFLLFLCGVAATFIFGKEGRFVEKTWVGGPDNSWMIRYDDAIAKAKKENKNVMVLVTGSDWCGWCKKLRRDVLEKKEFRDYAGKNLVLLWVDMPQNIPQPEAQRRHNEGVIRTLKFNGGVPSVKLISPNGAVLREQSGYLPLDRFMKFLQGK